jgi:hypothetical protein
VGYLSKIWKINIRWFLKEKECEVVDWLNIFQDRDELLSFVNMAMNMNGISSLAEKLPVLETQYATKVLFPVSATTAQSFVQLLEIKLAYATLVCTEVRFKD